MKFMTKDLNFAFGLLQIPLPEGNIPALERLAAAQRNGKELQVEILVPRKKRSLTANSALWAMLGDLAMVLKTTADELYYEVLRKYGVFEDLAVIPEAVTRLYGIYRIVEPTGDCVYGNKGRMDIYRCWPGSSTYDSREFSHLLDMVIEDAKEHGVDFIDEATKALLMEEREHGLDKAGPKNPTDRPLA